MKQKFLRALSYLLVAAVSVTATLAVVTSRGSGKLGELENLIDTYFIGEADPEVMEDAAADAMVKATGDRWSYYIPASSYAAYQEQMANAYVGVGITIQAQPEEGGFLILAVTPGGPAEEAGVQAGDLLIFVEDTDVRGLTAEEVGVLVKGEAGTFVNLTVQRREDPLRLRVERRQVKTQVASGELLPGNIGLVTIANFDTRCAEETIEAIDGLLAEGADRLIFDVRGNPGGYADELIQVLDYLLPEGEVFHTVDYQGKENIDYSDASCVDVPMAVLVDGDSYSAAEFFAAALREYGVARVVGTKTVGKGYFQSTFRLSDGSAVSLSIGKYYTPKGENLAGVGLTPDVEVPLDEEAAGSLYYGALAHEDDPQLQAAIQAVSEWKD